MNITRLDADRYLVGSVIVTRTDNGWAAIPPADPTDPASLRDRPLFTMTTLDEALDMCAGAIEMLRPA